ncbi:MAG: DUF4838 domain-containing protein [Verrucomicrobiae bacterium]|nr:DUF4838 domain-containing protein [Verrucomicrobiae bacterium]
MSLHRFAFAVLVGFAVPSSLSVSAIAAPPPTVLFAGKDSPPLPIVIESPGDWHGDETLAPAVEDFRTLLSRMAGAEFEISPPETVADGRRIIRLKVSEKPDIPASDREHYRIVTSDAGIELRGDTPLALRHALYDLLHRLGFRQYFPGRTWEIVPKLPKIAVALDIDERPDYASRRIWYGYGLWEHNRENYPAWCARNRMAEGLKLNTGHAYGGIISRRKADFDAHPEFYALVDGKRDIRGQAKLCIGNPALRDTVKAYALDFFAENPGADSVSMDPSDGGGWCECDACAAIGPPSDRALLLANEVAEAVNARFPGKVVGMYAYSFHSPPPALTVHPRVIVSAATGFIRGGLSIDAIMTGWRAKGATLGVREYYSVHTWDRDLPGAARGANLDYLATTIPDFHAKGARYLSAESSDNWGCNGLGYYFASRVLWDTGEAARRDEIVADFLAQAFGPAREPMEKFYTLIEGSNKNARLVYDDLLARMFRRLGEARELAGGDEAIRRRVDELVLYTRYVELFDRYRNAREDARQRAFEDLIRHGYRMRGTSLIHAYALYRDLAARDKSVVIPEGAGFRVPEPVNPWKSSEPFSGDDIEAMLGSGIANHQPVQLDFEPREFTENLVPATCVLESLPESAPGGAERMRGNRSFHTVAELPGEEYELRVTGGLIEHYRDRGNVRIAVWKIGGASDTGERETLIFEDQSVPPDGVERAVKWTARDPGVYRVDVADGHDLTRVVWPEGQRMSWRATLEDRKDFSGRWSLWFFVPKGTRTLGLYSAAQGGQLLRPDGKPALDLKTESGAFLSTPVPEGMDNTLWRIHSAAGKVALLNVPPWLARSPAELCLPAELAE